MEETANIVCNMAYKIGKDLTKKPYYQNKTTNEMPSNNINESDENNVVSTIDDSEEVQTTDTDYASVVKKLIKTILLLTILER